MNTGFLIYAQNTKDIDYVKCAIALAKNIKTIMPNQNVSILTNNQIDNQYKHYFDKVINLPYGDLDKDGSWKLINDWQVYTASPYDYTIKLEADMYLPKPIDHWFDVLKERDIVICTTIRNFKQEISNVRTYRAFIDDNKLPDCYNAITYFKKSDLAEQFFSIVKDVFENWERYKEILKCNVDENVTTDWAYALASHILGIEKTTLPDFTPMSMIHMKQYINNTAHEDWSKCLIYEILPNTLRINTIPQEYPFHYHVKSFAEKLL
jgi:hypothetical protein